MHLVQLCELTLPTLLILFCDLFRVDREANLELNLRGLQNGAIEPGNLVLVVLAEIPPPTKVGAVDQKGPQMRISSSAPSSQAAMSSFRPRTARGILIR